MAPPRRALLGAALATPFLRPARAAGPGGWPSRPVRLIVPFAPGGPTDVYARLLAEDLGRVFGQPFVTENRAGATGAIGEAAVARAAPDGDTLLFASSSSHVLGPLVARAPGFDAIRDFAPISLVISSGFYLLVNPALPVRTVPEFVDYARARSGALNFGSPGVGSGGHLATELFLQRTGIEAVHVPYSGAGPVVVAVSSGDVQFCFDTVGTSQTLVAAGRLRGLGLTSAARSAAVPDVPTMIESGYPELVAELWFGLLAPAATPAPILGALNEAVTQLLATPAMRDRMAQSGFDAGGGPPAQFAARIADETRRWTDVVQRAGLAAR